VKNIVITGTTTGIGRATKEKFEAQGWYVCSINRPEDDIREVSTIFNPVAVPADGSGIDVFVNNAGIMLLSDFEKTTLEDWDALIETNLRAPFFLCQTYIPYINDGGHLINIGSTIGEYPDKEFAAYAISKVGVIALTTALAKRYGERIFVNCINPGFVNTDITSDIEETPQELIDEIPMRRQAEPEEVAELIWFIVHNKYFNGSSIRFDGGMAVKQGGSV